MKSPFWCLFEFLSLTSAAVISPLVFLNTSESVNAVATQPIIENPDPRFKLEVRFDGPKLPLISCLMNTVEILMILGLQDFSGNMEKIAWKFDDYPHVGMVISPITQGGRIERRFAIWGLSQGVAHMIDLNRWQAVTITLSWNREKVGTIELVPWPETQYTNQDTHINPTQNQNISIAKSSSTPSLSPSITNTTANEVQDPRLTLRILLIGSTVPLFDVFTLIMTVLVHAARSEATDRLHYYVSPATATGLEVLFGESMPMRTGPPFFEVQWLIKSMALIPRYMIRKGVFKEASVMLDVDGVSIAAGFLGEKDAGVGLMNAKEGEKLESSLIVVRAETLFDFRLRNSKAP